MTLALAALVICLGAPVALEPNTSGRPKIIVLDLANGADLDDLRLSALNDALVTALSGAPVEVLSAEDLRATMAHRQALTAMGCMRPECLLDLASAWQARYVVTGSLAAFKERLILTLKLVDTHQGKVKVLLRETQEAEHGTITALTRVTAAKMRQALGGAPPTSQELAVLRAQRVPVWGWSVGALGVAAITYAIAVDRRTAIDLAEQALARADDPVLAPHFADQSQAVLTRSQWTLAAGSLGLGAATWLWWKGW